MIKVNFRGISNTKKPEQEVIARRACAALEQALNHPSFAGRVASAPYLETRFWDEDWNSFSVPPQEVYNYIASGAEMGTAGDSTIDIEVCLMKRNDVGGTVPGELPFYTSYRFIDGCIEWDDYISLAEHFIHEWLHVAGFHHHPDNDAREDVPYTVHEIVGDILKDMAKAARAGRAGGRASVAKRNDDTDADLAPMEKYLLAGDCGARGPSEDASAGSGAGPVDDLLT